MQVRRTGLFRCHHLHHYIYMALSRHLFTPPNMDYRLYALAILSFLFPVLLFALGTSFGGETPGAADVRQASATVVQTAKDVGVAGR
jgi:hypothetical protein